MSRALLLFFAVGCSTQVPAVYADPFQQAIIGGSDATTADHPHIVSLQNLDGDSFCGGTLIDPFWVLTAAHCLLDVPVGGLQVEVGHADLDEAGGTRSVAAMVRHPGHVRGDHSNDIALVRLAVPIVDVVPVPLLTRTGADTLALPGMWATVAGWGHIDLDGTDPDVLQEVDVPLIDLQTCIAHYPDRHVEDTMVCAGDLVDGGEDACNGDSGGPLTVPGPEGDVLLGVVSWGIGCADADRPGVYTRVPSFVNWIQHVVAGEPLDDHGDSPDQATLFPASTTTIAGELTQDDIDVVKVTYSGPFALTLQTTGGRSPSVRILDAARQVLAERHGAGEANLSLDVDGAVSIEIRSTTVGSYALQLDATSLTPPSSGGGGCGSNLWGLLAAGPLLGLVGRRDPLRGR